jgi:hypothetical protein
MKKYKIVFKNGETLIVRQDVVEGIKDTISKKVNYMTVLSNNDIVMTINILEIQYVIDTAYKA